MKFCLSEGAPPLSAGYSQSRSRPSNPKVLKNAAEVDAKFFLSVELETMVENDALPAVQPPTANSVLRSGLIALSPLNRAYLLKHKRISF